MSKQTIRNEAMRIGGEKIFTDKTIDVTYPYTEEVIATVPAGTAEHAKKAFEIAANYKPSLTRYERQQILFRAAEIIRDRREDIAHWLTLELGICQQHALYETGRSYDVFTLAGQLAIQDDGEIFSCDLTPHGKSRKIFTTREPVSSISAITPFNHLRLPYIAQYYLVQCGVFFDHCGVVLISQVISVFVYGVSLAY